MNPTEPGCGPRPGGGGTDFPAAPLASAPLIVTAVLPPDIQRWANALRTAHFPPERNHLVAHLTLFHALPPSAFSEASGLLAMLAGEEAAPLVTITGLLNLGRGTAIALASPALLELRARIAERFHGSLTAQDAHKPRLHITIQNKVTSGEARALQLALGDVVRQAPRDNFPLAGLALHHYLGPHWQSAGSWPLRKASPRRKRR